MKKKIIIYSMAVISFLLTGFFVINAYVSNIGAARIVSDLNDLPSVDAVIVPGALVYNGSVSLILQKRLDAALEVYNARKTNRILVSGDHGRKNYDEVNAMRDYLHSKGVPLENIFMDHAGFDTYDSIYRARDIFLIKTAIVTSQEFHNVRALYISENLGVKMYGYNAGGDEYLATSVKTYREYLARIKAFWEAGITKRNPKFLGDTIPITGSGILTEG